MIAVIADDFTGAAEIGGIGLQYGLRVCLLIDHVQFVDADLLIVATNSRSLPQADAGELMLGLTKQLAELNPVFVYKKLDSVLRGNVYTELKAHLQALNLGRALIVAGNPQLGRTIEEGTYYVNGTPLNETGFRNDPMFPATSSDVVELVRAESKNEVTNQKPTDPLPKNGMVVGDVSNDTDLMLWAEKRTEDVLYAGGAGLFDALLSASGMMVSGFEPAELGDKKLLVLGSAYPKSDEFMRTLESKGYAIFNMPREIYDLGENAIAEREGWKAQVLDGLKSGKAAVTMIHSGSDEPNLHRRLENEIANLVSGILNKISINELLVEGGSTLAAILEKLAIKQLQPTAEFAPGVIRMKPAGDYSFHITSKPGSYAWNEEIL